MTMSTDWNALLLAYLHDPPDKALSIRGHVSRAGDNAGIAVGDHVSRNVLEDEVSAADPLASIIERFPMPTAGDQGQRAVGPENGQLRIAHPLSAVARDLPVPSLNEQLSKNEKEQVQTVIADLPGKGQEQVRNRLLAVWRLWPDALAMNVHRCLALLPADTRTPDHTIWNHLDTTTAYKAALSGDGGPALLSFALGPVQRFIEAARTVRDLWSGSMILSWLAFRAILPIVEQLGPTALIYPALRANPMLDLWLRDPQRVGGRIPLPDVELRRTPALPHRFLALVPWGNDGASARDLAVLCQKAAEDAWLEIAQVVRQRIRDSMARACPDWDKRWDSQIGSYFSTATAVLPLGGPGDEIDRRLAWLLTGKQSFKEAFPNAEAIRDLARAIPASDRPSYDQDHAGRWQYQVELVQRSLAAQRSIRHVPPHTTANPGERCPQKCTLLGSFEQMGPDDLRSSKDFWDKVAAQNGLSIDGVRIRQGEALCAVALVKRFAGPALLAKQLGVEPADLRFPDTWTIAAAEWLETAKIDPNEIRKQHRDWNGHWLHWAKRDEDLTDADECRRRVRSNSRSPQAGQVRQTTRLLRHPQARWGRSRRLAAGREFAEGSQGHASQPGQLLQRPR
jgi:CRISPR-associated protein Cmr2